MQRALLLLIAGCGLGFAPVPFPKPGPKNPELKALQGEWDLVRSSFAGEWTDEKATAVIAGDRMTLRSGGAPTVWKIRLGVYRGLKVFDLETVYAEGVEKGSVRVGVYRLEGDVLTVCQLAADFGDLRPAVFDTANPVLVFKLFKRRKR
jgi:uncharacterized protein (TIGR03067 family)